MNEYYDGTKLLSMLDIDGNKPEIYMCTTNRTGGKTTYFGRWLINRFIKSKEKFMLVYRFNYELDDVSDKFFKDISSLFFKGYTMKTEKICKGMIQKMYLCSPHQSDEIGEHCGYAVALNSADNLKKYSHMFSDVVRMYMDEFQSETNNYCSDEIKKFISVHTSVARGQGEQYRYVPVIMTANPVSIINPYYVEMDISARLKEDTKFLKGSGFVLEQGYNESASKSQLSSGFNKAFFSNDYVAYSTQAVYLNDNKAFIEKPDGIGKYLGTIRYNNKDYALREFADSGVVYCDDRPDGTYPFKISVTTNDHKVNYIMLKRNDFFISNMRYYFDRGCFRFKDLRCKEALMKMISY